MIPLAFGIVFLGGMATIGFSRAGDPNATGWFVSVGLAIGIVANVASVAMLAVPVLTGHWTHDRHRLAIVSAVGIASLAVLYGLPVGAAALIGALRYGETGDRLALLWFFAACLVILAVAVSLGLAIATAVGTRGQRPDAASHTAAGAQPTAA